MTHAVRMTHDGDFCVLLDALDKLLATPRHDEVNVSVLGEKSGNFGAGRDGLDKGWGERRRGEGLGDQLGKEGRGVDRFTSRLENGGIAWDKEMTARVDTETSVQVKSEAEARSGLAYDMTSSGAST